MSDSIQWPSMTPLRRRSLLMSPLGMTFVPPAQAGDPDVAIVFVGGMQARALEEEGGRAAVTFAVSALAEIYGDGLRGVVA